MKPKIFPFAISRSPPLDNRNRLFCITIQPNENLKGTSIMRIKRGAFVFIILVLGMLMNSCGCEHPATELHNVAEAGCEAEGYTGDVFCLHCEKYITKGNIIPALSHKPEVKYNKEPTCAAEGYTGDTYCSLCNTILESGNTIPMINHQTELIGQVDTTCSQDGYTGDHFCRLCSSVITHGTHEERLPHTWDITGRVESTCISEGYEGDFSCQVCGKKQNGNSIPISDHIYEDNTCTVCGWIPAGLYVDNEMVMPWADLINSGYVNVQDGQLISTKGNFQMGRLVIGEDVTYIEGNYTLAFDNNTIKEVWIPRTVTKLGNYLIAYNKSITDIVLFCQISEIMENTFSRSEVIETIVMPDTIKRINQSAFQGCPNLKNINWPEALEYIGREAFYGCGIDHVVLPDKVETIGQLAFGGSELISIVLPASINELDGEIFKYCSSLLSVDMSECEKITHLEEMQFFDCEKLSAVKLPPNLRSMGSRMFSNCYELKKLELPDTFCDVGGNYWGCFSNAHLTEIIIPLSLIDMGNLVDCPLTNIKYKGTEAQWKMTTGYNVFTNAEIEYEYMS